MVPEVTDFIDSDLWDHSLASMKSYMTMKSNCVHWGTGFSVLKFPFVVVRLSTFVLQWLPGCNACANVKTTKTRYNYSVWLKLTDLISELNLEDAIQHTSDLCMLGLGESYKKWFMFHRGLCISIFYVINEKTSCFVFDKIR